MSLPVSEMARSGKTSNSECILCGNCADRCAKGALKLGFCFAKSVHKSADTLQSADTTL